LQATHLFSDVELQYSFQQNYFINNACKLSTIKNLTIRLVKQDIKTIQKFSTAAIFCGKELPLLPDISFN
jgi:hypothetical protein